MDKLYIVIPAYNEQANIEQVATEWHQIVAATGSESRLVIIDDGSKDNTYALLCQLQERLPQLIALTKENGGHGATLLFGYEYALAQGADYIFQTDSDGQTLPTEFPPFWAQREQYALIIGNRNARQDGASRVLVTKVLKLVLFLVFGHWIPDANTPFRLMQRERLAHYMQKIPEKFNLSNVMLTVLMIDGGEPVRFEPITFRARQGGVNSINFKKIVAIGLRAFRDFRAIRRGMKQQQREH